MAILPGWPIFILCIIYGEAQKSIYIFYVWLGEKGGTGWEEF
jgi:hypothetical protein